MLTPIILISSLQPASAPAPTLLSPDDITVKLSKGDCHKSYLVAISSYQPQYNTSDGIHFGPFDIRLCQDIGLSTVHVMGTHQRGECMV